MKQSIVYLFSLVIVVSSLTQASAQDWSQMGSDIDGEAAGDNSGRHSISADGTIVAIGAPRNDANGEDSGHVRVYHFAGGSWIQRGADIDGEAAGDGSGNWVSLSSNGMVVAVGAPQNDGNGAGSGHVRVYRFEQGSWIQVGKDIDGEAENDLSGASLTLSADGTIIAIGAPGNDGNGSFSGQVRVYQFANGNWNQLGADIDGDDAYSSLGSYVTLSADGSVVAMNLRTPSDVDNSGTVRVVRFTDGSWSQVGADIYGEAENDGSGTSLALSADGTIVAIGAPGNDGNGDMSGHVRVYQFTDGTWTQLGADIDGEATGDRSGYQVSLSADGSVVGIGAPNNQDHGDRAGQVRVYHYADGSWSQLGSDIDGKNAGDFLNYVSLSADGRIVATGATWSNGDGENSGSVCVFELIKLIPLNMVSNHLEFPTVSNAQYTLLSTTNLNRSFEAVTNFVGNGLSNAIPVEFDNDQRFYKCSEVTDDQD